MHDRYRRKHNLGGADPKTRRKIATEAARRVFAQIGPDQPGGRLGEASVSELYEAKRKAAAVLGLRVRPGDLPSDSEVREAVVALAKAGPKPSTTDDGSGDEAPTLDLDGPGRLGDHIDRFEVYRLRLEPLADVKQDPRRHPEGDVLYHSLQVFELARTARPFDEDFLLAALLHDVGKAIDPDDPTGAALQSLAGTLDARTDWLIGHLQDLSIRPGYPGSRKAARALRDSEHYEDLALLLELDEAGRVPGAEVPPLDEALAFLRELADESLPGTEPKFPEPEE